MGAAIVGGADAAPIIGGMATRTGTWTAAAVALLLACASACDVLAQIQAAEKATAPPPTAVPGPASDAAATADDLRRELAAAQAEVDAIEAAGPEAGAPPGTPASESGHLRALARQRVAMLQQQLDALERTTAAAAKRVAAERADREWAGLPGSAPWSVTLIDAIRDDLDAAENGIAAAASRRVLLERFSTDLEPRLKASQAAARRAAEAAEAGRGTAQAARLEWARDLAALQARVDVGAQRLIEMGRRAATEEEAAAQAARALARRQLAAAGGAVTLSEADLAAVKSDLEARARAAAQAFERASQDATAAIERRSAAEARLAQLRASDRAGEDAAAREAEAARDADLAREKAATATLRSELLRDYQLVLAGERVAWEARHESLATNDPVKARAAYERLASSLVSLRARREFLSQELAAAAARIGETEAKLRTASLAEAAHLNDLLDALHARETVLRNAIKAGEPLEQLVARFRADLEGRRSASFVDEARDAGAAALLQARRLWNYEVLTVDDTYETADGRKLNVSRGITVGKTLGAVLIVVVGYWLTRGIMRRTERVMVARGRVAPQSAALLRSWVLFAATAILVVIALAIASIPLTVFAFLGGALAIAAGFGLQTLLKNLVAGIILLVERPMRLNDLVEVEGVRGRVTEIGVRASTIRTGDGIESLLPNSAFLEGKLTNWTYSSPQTRQTIVVGVAYGTPLREAADVLAGVLARHGLVLKAPAPQVYLDEYADSAIRFALTYWLDMTPDSDARRVKSDLLHMVDSAFAEAGIRMPFPQLDVHLDRGPGAA
ncbi:MAG: mechanosensitive ion channel [Burkholderiales bacterium]